MAGTDIWAVAQDAQRWRLFVSTRVMLMTAAAEAAGALVFLASLDQPGLLPWVTLAVAVVTGTVALRGDAPPSLRAAALLTGVWLAALASLSRNGFTPNSSAVLLVLVCSATVLLGGRWGLITTAAGALTLVFTGVLHRSGAVSRVADWSQHSDDTRLDVIIRIPVVFCFLGLLVTATAAYVLARAEALLAEKDAALVALEEEKRRHLAAQEELRRHEETWLRAQQLESVGRLAGTVAHDFNNALTVFHGVIEHLRGDPSLGDASRAAVEDLAISTEQAAATAAQLRTLSPSGAQQPVRMDLGPLLNRTAKALQRVFPPAVAISVDVPQPVVAFMEEGQLMRALTNLAFNARDAMRSGGTLRFSATVQGGFARLDVADNGHGMSPDVKAHAFEPYYTTKGERGTGLGLASVREVVEHAGGQVELASEEGRGTTVTLSLPLAPPPRPLDVPHDGNPA